MTDEQHHTLTLKLDEKLGKVALEAFFRHMVSYYLGRGFSRAQLNNMLQEECTEAAVRERQVASGGTRIGVNLA